MTGNPEGNSRKMCRLRQSRLRQEKAFTLVELLVVLALSAVALAIIYKTLPAQNKVYLIQDQVVEMQQQLRAVMDVMVREIRMAGYNPKGCSDSACGCPPGILTAAADSLCLTQDITGGETDTIDNDGDSTADEEDENIYPDGDCKDSKETITYEIGTNSAGKPCLRRKSSVSSGFQIIAENIEVLNLVYFDENAVVLATPLTGANLAKVRSIQVTLLARTDREDQDYKNTTVYRNPQGTTLFSAPGDGYRRRLLTTTVQCHNMGL